MAARGGTAVVAERGPTRAERTRRFAARGALHARRQRESPLIRNPGGGDAVELQLGEPLLAAVRSQAAAPRSATAQRSWSPERSSGAFTFAAGGGGGGGGGGDGGGGRRVRERMMRKAAEGLGAQARSRRCARKSPPARSRRRRRARASRRSARSCGGRRRWPAPAPCVATDGRCGVPRTRRPRARSLETMQAALTTPRARSSDGGGRRRVVCRGEDWRELRLQAATRRKERARRAAGEAGGAEGRAGRPASVKAQPRRGAFVRARRRRRTGAAAWRRRSARTKAPSRGDDQGATGGGGARSSRRLGGPSRAAA